MILSVYVLTDLKKKTVEKINKRPHFFVRKRNLSKNNVDKKDKKLFWK